MILQPGEFTESPKATGVIIPKGEFFDHPPLNTVTKETTKPGVGESIKMGFAQQPLPENSGFISNVAHFAGETGPVIAGAAIGEALNPLGGGIVGAAGARALQKGVAQTTGMAPVQKPLDIATDVYKTAALQKLGELAGPYFAKVLKGTAKAPEAISGQAAKSLLKKSGQVTPQGQDPIQGLMDEGIFAKSWKDFGVKVSAKIKEIGGEYNKLFSSPTGDIPVDFTKVTKPIEDAIDDLSVNATENKAVINKLTDIWDDVSKNATVMPAREAQRIKNLLKPKYSASPTAEENIVNATKQHVRAVMASQMHDVVPGLSALDSRFGNIAALAKAVGKRAPIAEGNDIFGLPEIGFGMAAMTHEADKEGAGIIAGIIRALKFPAIVTGMTKVTAPDIGVGSTLGAMAESSAGNTIIGNAVGKYVGKYIPTPLEIKAKYKAGELDKATAAKMLRENHGFK